MHCPSCNSQRTGAACWKCGSELKPVADGWEYPKLPPIDRIRELAREVGYAIGEHGSKERDLDLIAAPWTDDAVDPLSLVCHIAIGLKSVDGRKARVVDGGETRPHGRVGYNIQLDGWYKLIDISVMPLAAANERLALERAYSVESDARSAEYASKCGALRTEPMASNERADAMTAERDGAMFLARKMKEQNEYLVRTQPYNTKVLCNCYESGFGHGMKRHAPCCAYPKDSAAHDAYMIGHAEGWLRAPAPAQPVADIVPDGADGIARSAASGSDFDRGYMMDWNERGAAQPAETVAYMYVTRDKTGAASVVRNEFAAIDYTPPDDRITVISKRPLAYADTVPAQPAAPISHEIIVDPSSGKVFVPREAAHMYAKQPVAQVPEGEILWLISALESVMRTTSGSVPWTWKQHHERCARIRAMLAAPTSPAAQVAQVPEATPGDKLAAKFFVTIAKMSEDMIDAREVVWRIAGLIEACGASPELTAASGLAFDLHDALGGNTIVFDKLRAMLAASPAAATEDKP